MRFNAPIHLQKIAGKINRVFIGPENHIVFGIIELNVADQGDLIFVYHPKYFDKAIQSKAQTIIINARIEAPKGKAIIISDEPFNDYNELCKSYFPTAPLNSNINQQIHSTAILGNNVALGNNIKIGQNVQIMPGAVIMDNVTIGSNVFIGPNAVIGHNAFYYNKSNEKHSRMHTMGGVTIHDNVEIGANSTIDSGVSSNTEIGNGTKIDNLVQIGHDTVIGKHCIIAAGSAIAGCVTIKNHVTIWGQVGCTSKVTIHNHVVVLAQSGVSKDLEEGKTYFGTPCVEAKQKFRELAVLRNLSKTIEK